MMQRGNLNHLRIPLTDIRQATNGFSDTCFIGSGGFGNVYKAELELEDINLLVAEGANEGVVPKKRSTVAIKRISDKLDAQGKQGFFTEIEMLSRCRHSNIVSLLGFCDEESEMILVYEYVSKGSLDKYLGNDFNLTRAQRLQICLDIAHGLNYLHAPTKDKNIIVHRDIKSANILLDDNWVPKIADFGFSKLHDAGQQHSTIATNNVAGTLVYLDPEYMISGKLKTKSDIYSLGVVFFEIMCGKLAYNEIYNKGLPSIVRRSSKNGTLMDLVDPKVKEAGKTVSMQNEGGNQYSLDPFLEVASKCLAKTQSDRPTIEEIIEELAKALTFQNTTSPEAIKWDREDFSDSKCIGKGRFWKLYEGEVAHAPVLVKQWDTTYDQRHSSFLKELDILLRYKHENIIAVVGHFSEKDEHIIVYENASNRSLDKHLCDPNLTWIIRLKICLDIAKGLEYLHECYVGHKYLVEHRDIKSGSILIDENWKAKISNFEMSCKHNISNSAEHLDDPEYETKICLMHFPDLYSLGVILLEMLSGRSAWEEGCKDHSQSLVPLAKRRYAEKGNLEKMIFEDIKEQIAPKSLDIFQSIAIQCLDYGKLKTSQVVSELKKALKFQEDYEIWEPNLVPVDYREIISSMSTNSEINNPVKTKKAQYDMFNKGVLLEGRKVLFSLGRDGARNEMISSRMFSYKNRTSYMWQSIQESRFKKVAQMFDISKLNIQIDVTTRFLSPGVMYGAYIVFKFCDTRKTPTKPMYVNLKYKKGGENLHAYFATQRDNERMMNIELCRFVAHKKETRFEVLLESFSRRYCGNNPIYIDGIEFQVIDNVKTKEIEEVPQIPKPNSNKDKRFLFKYLSYLQINPFSQPSDARLPSLNEVNQKKHLMLSANQVLHDPYNPKHFHVQSSAKSRFQEVIEQFLWQTSAKSRFKEVIELLPQRVFRINCEIQAQTLSEDTEYLCYLVFKLSEKCHGLHCPVKVRDLLHKNNEVVKIVYFRTSSPWNLHENNSVPKAREDGWMEVEVRKFNSKDKITNGCIPVDLKFLTYEGTMSGLIVCGMEFRPMHVM